ncbi:MULTISPECIES: hypothetical protein [Curtobacterium]|jgi:hypothetical protein|uniref:Uncharacterized protein n=1 Tax=Curtobacterium poinsettiae TaxID=159612 RepID=A0A9Q9PAN7_9MICO|nr:MULTISPECIES: hypothetical protein [Curtobacterium]MBF4595783.1 hypothetical protein [Curtobacterium flaccumfaciens]MBF4596296.1 hypothetical protein [Curtobacterium sp. VKM Ac-1796]MBF4611413.1 hypothetical protein [Curtobacterium sp. VKM Ac-2889]MBF4628079.1 hypothetical protein [Curtobacterium flaccumfaciens]MBO9038888.1 hypothetical protein [Curtobacterium flaccumfaciens pv. flaccumfaciens]
MQSTLNQLRSNPVEWRRRGLTPPDVIQAMIEQRLAEPGHSQPVGDPSYQDFFRS